MRVYTASKVKHAPLWVRLRDEGLHVIATWIDEAGEGQTPDRSELAERCLREVGMADLLLLYCEPDDLLKGALVEAGAALALGKPVLCVGTCASISRVFVAHPLWRGCATLEEALAEITHGLRACLSETLGSLDDLAWREILGRVREADLLWALHDPGMEAAKGRCLANVTTNRAQRFQDEWSWMGTDQDAIDRAQAKVLQAIDQLEREGVLAFYQPQRVAASSGLHAASATRGEMPIRNEA
jgi:hypothetical protein